VGHVASTRGMQHAYRILLWHKWEDNTQMEFKEIWCQDVDWIHVAIWFSSRML
jgi:hypothetical protein